MSGAASPRLVDAPPEGARLVPIPSDADARGGRARRGVPCHLRTPRRRSTTHTQRRLSRVADCVFGVSQVVRSRCHGVREGRLLTSNRAPVRVDRRARTRAMREPRLRVTTTPLVGTLVGPRRPVMVGSIGRSSSRPRYRRYLHVSRETRIRSTVSVTPKRSAGDPETAPDELVELLPRGATRAALTRDADVVSSPASSVGMFHVKHPSPGSRREVGRARRG